MSTSLYFMPNTPKGGETLPRALKYVIAPKFWDHDGSLNGASVVIDAALVPYFEGLRDAKVEGAQQVLDLVEKHGSIVIWLEG